jgi:hypothetical protein
MDIVVDGWILSTDDCGTLCDVLVLQSGTRTKGLSSWIWFNYAPNMVVENA